ncbi:hypothetical protein EDD37DRAFT_563010 [Exophiala viscosa]|uniref:uncharacterized protein n=1 Tax=Exophiala viscosa TaxID=2486360 RepID=UPI0021963A95|nr:hypothetical protein EDD37DRAFT_563010 [Exophiala viscosa]
MTPAYEDNEDGDSDDPLVLLGSLQTRAQALLDELTAYRALLKTQNKQQSVEMRIFRRGVESEVKSVAKITQRFRPSERGVLAKSAGEDDTESPQLHALRSSNLPFYEAVWVVAKSRHGITALGKRVYWDSCDSCKTNTALDKIGAGRLMAAPNKVKKKSVLVDIVAENGLEWIKVSTMTEKRLLFEMAKEGWEAYGDYSESGESDNSEDTPSRQAGKLELVRVAEDLREASKRVRIRFRRPHVHFVLPNIREGVIPDVDELIADLRATGATVESGIPLQPSTVAGGPSVFDQMMPAIATVSLTGTMNIDCTILLALISDISHFHRDRLSAARDAESGTYHTAILRQIESEESDPLLPTEIYPLLVDRKLECTSHAAQRMREIVQCMGTTSERKRADIILGEGAYSDQSEPVLRQALREVSIHALPEAIRVPIRVVEFDMAELIPVHSLDNQHAHPRGHMFPSSIASRVASTLRLSPINASVFLYGWVKNIVTLTSNRAIATGMLKTINDLLDQDEQEVPGGSWEGVNFIGPQMFICETARSLVGKAKGKAEE